MFVKLAAISGFKIFCNRKPAFRQKSNLEFLFVVQKSGMTAKDAYSRAKGFQKYIKAQNKKGRKFWEELRFKKMGVGGITIKK